MVEQGYFGEFMRSVVKNIFSAKSSRVLRVLLVNVARDWNERELAKETAVSRGMAHYVCRSLIELGYISRNGRNRLVLVDPLRLLKRWAAYHQYDKINTFLEYYTFEREVDRFIRQLSTLNDTRYALTALAGAFLIAPHVRPVDVHMYVVNKEDAATIAKALNLQPIPKGGNVKFVLPYDKGVFYGQQKASVWISDQVVSGVNVVSTVQLYVDLYNFPARGEEAASHLLDNILKKWKEKQ
jgi:hypothetical protein